MRNLYPQSGAVVVGRSTAAAPVNPIIGSPASDTVLGRLVITGSPIASGLGAEIRDIIVGGISLNGTSHPVLRGFFDPSTRYDGQDFLGLPVKQRVDIVIGHAASETLNVAWMCDPVTDDMRPIGDVRDYPARVPMYWGLQPVTIAANSSGKSVTVVQKPGTLGPLVMGLTSGGAAPEDVLIDSITINGLPLLNAAAGAQGATLAMYGPTFDDVDGKTEPVIVETNDIIEFAFSNLDPGNAATVYGMFFALPVVPPG